MSNFTLVTLNYWIYGKGTISLEVWCGFVLGKYLILKCVIYYSSTYRNEQMTSNFTKMSTAYFYKYTYHYA